MIKKLLWLFLLLPFCTQAQISGRLLDSETLEPIPYAQITIANPKAQTYSTENGQFNFTQLDYDKNYTLSIDALGYFNKEINTSELNNNPDILLDLNEEVLPELYIIPENAKTKIRTYGQTKEGSSIAQVALCGRNVEELTLSSEEADITEGGGIFVNNKTLSKVLSAHLHISENSYKKAVVKVQLYDITNEKSIVHEPIIFNITDKKTGWFKVNLEDKNIYVGRESKKIAIMFDFVYFKPYDDTADTQPCLLMNAILPSFGTMVVIKDDNEKWRKVPLSFPLYLTVETYSW